VSDLAEILAELDALRDAFRADAVQQVDAIADGWAALAGSTADGGIVPGHSAAEALLAESHRLAGTAGTFGLGALSSAAAALEDHLADLIDAPHTVLDRAVGDRYVARMQAAIG
jgi:HPt (histidine-containing phosphotransfer) domain-containing protein